MCKVSIIVPVYNTEQYLARCIDSILSQSFTDFELLLVDDGSTDGSGAICDVYAEKDNRVRVVHKENGGVSSARNVGLKEVKGEFVVFVDADDWVKEQYLEHLMCSDADLVVTGYQSFGLSELLIIPEKRQEKKVESLLDEWDDMYGYVFAKRFRFSIIRDNNLLFEEKLFYCEDDCFVLNYINCVCKYMNVPFADYQHGLFEVGKNRDRKYKMSVQQLIVHYEYITRSFMKIGVSLKKLSQNSRLFRKFLAWLSECDNIRVFRKNALIFRNQKWAKTILVNLKGRKTRLFGYGVYYCPVVTFFLRRFL